VQVESDRIFVKEGVIWTSAGVTAGIDLALALIEEDLGVEPAKAAAQELVVSLSAAWRPVAVLGFARTGISISAGPAGVNLCANSSGRGRLG